ncbi:TIM barrel protein [Candidatus Woesearchaeota archaeon]|nr:TIM barrel protein [Candidatus Woesearchaeota archaeon]
MEVGIKLWSTNPEEHFQNSEFADFIEIMPVSLDHLDRIAKVKKKFTMHVPHESFGFNPAIDYGKSKALLEQGVAAAKKLNCEKLVMHASHHLQKMDEHAVKEAIAATAKLAREAKFPGLVIENSTVFEITKDNTRQYIGYSREQMKELLDLSGVGFCLDLEHAAIAASQLGISFKEHANALLKLKPDYFHLSGALLSDFTPKGHHMSLFEGDVDKEFAQEVLRKAGKPVCLETPLDIEQRKKEVEFLKS